MTSHSNFARSPLMDNVLNFVPEGHEKALKQAMYNAVGMVIVGIGTVALTAVYFVLHPFLRPLLWALFFGSVLHPVKRRLNIFVHRWIGDLRSSNTPFTVGLVLLPLGIFDSLADGAVNSVYRHWKLSTVVTIILVAPYYLYTYTPQFVITVAVVIKDLIFFLLGALQSFSPYLIWTLSAAFVLAVLFYWKSDTKKSLCLTSLVIWALLFLNFSTVFGSLAALVAIGVFIVGLGVEVHDAIVAKEQQAANEEGASESPIKTAWSVLCGNMKINSSQNGSAVPRLGVDSSQQGKDNTNTPLNVSKRHPSVIRQDSFSTLLASDKVEKISDVYLYIVCWACFLVLISRTITWIWPLILVSVIYFVTKKLGVHFGLWSRLWGKILDGANVVVQQLDDRQDALFPAPVRGICKLLLRGDNWVTSCLEKMADILTTMGSILFVLICVIMGVTFLLLQIHSESMHLFQVTSNLINSTVVHNEVVQNMLPEEISNVMDSMYDNAYEYSKEWVVKLVRHLIPEDDDEKSIIIEVQVLELWEKVYNSWTASGIDSNSQPTNNGTGVFGIINELGSSPELFNWSSMVAFVKENVDTFVAVLQASWSVLKGNISLALSAVTITVSIIFGGGSALLSFLFNLIIFLTALFYLLSGSDLQYYPIVFIGKIAPGVWGNKLAHAVEEAINGVFTASLKMAVFYGLWTWLIHKLFQVKMVYIPSVLAATFGAIPFLGTYWAVLPAVMELWLVQGNWMMSIVMVIFQILPMSCVDTAIYSEIHGGGHPYLTGLSVAGGMFCLGVEGAIVGPLILCCFFVVINMSTSMMNESPMATPGRRLLSKTFLGKR
ncbi:hypothetical protein CHUAL_010438 [Chamberlinius hualienensis]